MVIPVYRATIEGMEERSFLQGLNVLGKHKIAVVGPEGMDYGYYVNLAKERGVELMVEMFPDSYFSSVAAYNALCLAKEFYCRFAQYDYMLICQTDAWVFQDELDEWCSKGYDYIGAPHFFPSSGGDLRLRGVGNGGFSLRRIDYCLWVTASLPKRLPYFSPKALNELVSRDNSTIVRVMELFLKMLGVKNSLGYFNKGNNINEDYVLGTYANHSWLVSPKLPDVETAARFSFETHPAHLYKMIGDRLPFGCHAYMKYDYDTFWSKYIS